MAAGYELPTFCPSNGLKQIVGYWFSQITSQFCKERKVINKRSILLVSGELHVLLVNSPDLAWDSRSQSERSPARPQRISAPSWWEVGEPDVSLASPGWELGRK